jgi:Protein of unknown function (DUF1553)
VEVADGKTSNYFLTTFGRKDREGICSREEVGPTLSQALHLLNGDTVEGKIQQGGVVKRLIEANKTPREIVQELYLRTFNRQPTEDELIKLETHWGVTEEQGLLRHLLGAAQRQGIHVQSLTPCNASPFSRSPAPRHSPRKLRTRSPTTTTSCRSSAMPA